MKRTYHIIFWLGGLLMFLSACGIQKEYKISDMSIPEDYHLPDTLQGDLDSIIVPWNIFFEDTMLKNLIGEAMTNNFTLRQADKDMLINEQYNKMSKYALAPTINLNLLNIERSWNSSDSRSGVEEEWYDAHDLKAPEDMFVSKSLFSSTVSLDWEVDIWGKFLDKRRIGEANYAQSYEVLKALQTEVVSTVAEDYYTLLMLESQIDVAQTNERFRDSTLHIIELQYNAGEVTALAVTQAKSQVLEAQTLVLSLLRSKTIIQNKLRLLIGQLPGEIEHNLDEKMLATIYNKVDSIPLYLLHNRPDVEQARLNLVVANANLGLAQKERLPSIGISLEGGLESQLGENWFNIPGALMGDLIGGITAPLLQGRRLKTQFEVAKLERDKAEINFQYVVYRAILDIENTLVTIKNLKQELLFVQEQHELAQISVINSRMLFQSGFASYLEVITAQGLALDTEIALIQTQRNLLLAKIQLYRALGGGWK